MKNKFQTSAAFPEPNYTQVPNDFFDMLPDMEASEARVTIVMIRNTFGFHRNEFKMSIDKLAASAGISHNSAKSGAEAAEKRGTFKRSNKDGKSEAKWELIVEGQPLTPLNHCTPGGQPLTPTGSTIALQSHVKESIKEESKEILNPEPKPKSAQQLMIDTLCSVMGLEVNLNAARVAKFAKELVEIQVTPAQVESKYKAGAWWYQNDWRGKRGQKPTETGIRETINEAAQASDVKWIRPPQKTTIRQPR